MKNDCEHEIALKFLYQMGVDVLLEGEGVEDNEADFIYYDDDELCFAFVTDEPSDKLRAPTQKESEYICTSYLKDHTDTPSSAIRFDLINTSLINETKALMRWHKHYAPQD